MILKSLIVLSLGLAACSAEESVNSSATTRIANPFLTVTDIAQTTRVQELSSTDVAETLAGYELVYLNPPSESSEELSCRNALFSRVGLEFKGKTLSEPASLSHGIDADYTTCRRYNQGERQTIESSRLQLFRRFGCEYIDPEAPALGDQAALASHNGKSGSVLDTVASSQNCTKKTFLTTGKILSKVSGMTGTESAGDLSRYSYTETTYLYTGTRNLLACSESKDEDTWSVDDECKYVWRRVRSNYVIDGVNQPADESYLSLIPTGLTYPDGDTASLWYGTGSMAVVLNDWRGNLSFSAVETAASYTLANSIQTVTGALTPRSASLR